MTSRERIQARYVGNSEQLYGVRRIQLQDGPAKGSDIFEVHTAAGLQADILIDSGLDIGQVRYQGTNVSFISKNGYDSPIRYSSHGSEFLHSFPGGMLYTCGLRNTGAACFDQEESHPMHGRYHSYPAMYPSASIQDNNIIITGEIRETSLFGPVLSLYRKISIPVDSSSLSIEDTLTNLTPTTEGYLLLYHFNFGYPFFSEDTLLTLPPQTNTTARTAFAQEILGSETRFEPPVDGQEERVYFHHTKNAEAILQNPSLGLKASLCWDTDMLPILIQWRSMASGDYALGLEPSNSLIRGREEERRNGCLPFIEGFCSKTIGLQLNFSSLK